VSRGGGGGGMTIRSFLTIVVGLHLAWVLGVSAREGDVPASAATRCSATTIDMTVHSVFSYLKRSGYNALANVEQYRRRSVGSRQHT